MHPAADPPFQQGGTANSPIQAIPAAISTKTSLLLGLWASAGDANFANEIAALKSAIATYGSQLGGLVAGISVGSEDLYRISPTGILNKENPGVGPDVLVGYIKQVRDAIAGTPLSGVPVGHVDTWTAWVNASNDAVISASDWLGVDAYPYFQVCLPAEASMSCQSPRLTSFPTQDHNGKLHLERRVPLQRRIRPDQGRRQGQGGLGDGDGLAHQRPRREPGRRQHGQRGEVLGRGRLPDPLRQDQHVVVHAPGRCAQHALP